MLKMAVSTFWLVRSVLCMCKEGYFKVNEVGHVGKCSQCIIASNHAQMLLKMTNKKI